MFINIQSIHFDADHRLLELINMKLSKFEKYFDRIEEVEVYLKLENASAQVKDKTVEIRVKIPGNTFFAKETTKTFEDSLEAVEDSIKRQLTKHKDKLRG